MFQYSHYIDSKYPAKKSEPPPTDDSVVQPMTSSVTYGNILFNDYKTEELATQIMDIKLKTEGLQKERDFYYNKLRDIESFLRVMEDGYMDQTVKRILAIVYETQEIRKVKKKRGRNKRRNGGGGGEDDLEDFPLVDYSQSNSGSGTLRT